MTTSNTTTPQPDEPTIIDHHRLDGLDPHGRRVLVIDLIMTDQKSYAEPGKLQCRGAQAPNRHLLPFERYEEMWRDRLESLAKKRGVKLP